MPLAKEISPTKTPERFYLPIKTGETTVFDDAGKVAEVVDILSYELENRAVDNLVDSVAYEKKSLNGVQRLVVDDDATRLYETVDGVETLVAESKVYMEVNAAGRWTRFDFGRTTPTDRTVLSESTADMGTAKTVGDASIDIDIQWRGGANQSSKQTFALSCPNQRIRCVWQITAFRLDGLNVNYDDYKGKFTDTDFVETGETWTRTITFEPDGVDGKLTVDPYLSVDEQSSYIDVDCDGFVFRISKDVAGSEEALAWIRDDSSELAELIARLYRGSPHFTTRYFGQDTGRTTEIIESNPRRVVIRVVGDWPSTTESDSLVYTWYIYDDRVFADIAWTTTDEVDAIHWQTPNSYLIGLIAAMTNENNVYENSGSESDATGNHASADYLALTADEMNVQIATLDYNIVSGDATHHQTGTTDGEIKFGVANGDIGTDSSTETHTFRYAIFIDSAERETWAGYNDEQRFDASDFDHHVTAYWDCESDTVDYGANLGSTKSVTKLGNSEYNSDGLVGSYGLDTIDTSSGATLANASNDIFDPTSFMLSFYFKPHLAAGSDYIFDYRVDANNRILLVQYYSSGSVIGLNMGYMAGGTYEDMYSATDIMDIDSWYLVQIYAYGGVCGMMVDGVHVDDAEAIGGTWSGDTGTIYFGREYDVSSGCNMSIDEVYFLDTRFPKHYDSVARLAIGDKRQDTTIADPTNGDWITDLIIPANIGVDGFASDGALHAEKDSNDNLKFDWDATRKKPVVVLDDTSGLQMTVDGSNDLCTFYDKMDSVTTGHSPEIGTGTVTVAGSPDLNSNDGFRGGSVNFDANGEYFQAAVSGNFDYAEGTLIFGFRLPTVADTVSRYIFSADNSNREFTLIVDALERIQVYVDRDNLAYCITSALTDYLYDDQFNIIHFAWKRSEEFVYLGINGNPIALTKTNFSSWSGPTASGSNFAIGNRLDSTTGPAKGDIDNFKIFSKAVVPYGAIFTGNGAVDTDVAHKDITALVKGDESDGDPIAIGSGTVEIVNATLTTDVWGNANSAFLIDGTGEHIYIQETNNIVAAKGLIAFWYKTTGTPDSYCRFFADSNAENTLRLTRESTTSFSLRVNSTSIYPLNFSNSIYDGNWHHVAVSWDCDENLTRLLVNGVLEDTDTTAITAPTLSNNLYIGNSSSDNTDHIGGAICDIYITNNPYTPQIWTALGAGPLYSEVIEVT